MDMGWGGGRGFAASVLLASELRIMVTFQKELTVCQSPYLPHTMILLSHILAELNFWCSAERLYAVYPPVFLYGVPFTLFSHSGGQNSTLI